MPLCDGKEASEQICEFLSDKDVSKPYICLLTSVSKMSLSDGQMHGIDESIMKPIFKDGVRKILTSSGLLQPY